MVPSPYRMHSENPSHSKIELGSQSSLPDSAANTAWRQWCHKHRRPNTSENFTGMKIQSIQPSTSTGIPSSNLERVSFRYTFAWSATPRYVLGIQRSGPLKDSCTSSLHICCSCIRKRSWQRSHTTRTSWSRIWESSAELTEKVSTTTGAWTQWPYTEPFSWILKSSSAGGSDGTKSWFSLQTISGSF